jgi:hypothetical protein
VAKALEECNRVLSIKPATSEEKLQTAAEVSRLKHVLDSEGLDGDDGGEVVVHGDRCAGSGGGGAVEHLVRQHRLRTLSSSKVAVVGE